MSLNELLQSLQEEYLDELPSRIDGIKIHFINKDIQALTEDFHKLKGTGRTYGIPEISDLGERMEQLLLSCPAVGFSQVNQALDLLAEIHHTRTSGAPFEIALDARFHHGGA